MNYIQKFKNWLKRNRNSSNPFLRFGIRVFDAIVSFVRGTRKLIVDPNARAIMCMKLFHPGRTHQTTEATCMNRYPSIFSGCKAYFGDQEEIRILSFGCSTGEEVVTLRQYFPKAEIVGAEINKHSLHVCRQRNMDEKVHFVDSLPEEIQRFAPYDVIFCMAVLQRTPGLIVDKQITNLEKIYPFEKFESQVTELDGYLKESGLMVIHMSQYDFTDTSVAENYVPYGDYNQDYYGSFVFDKESKRKTVLSRRHSVYIKGKNV